MFTKAQVVIDLEEYNELLKIKRDKEVGINPEKEDLNALKQSIGEALLENSGYGITSLTDKFIDTLKLRLKQRGYLIHIQANRGLGLNGVNQTKDNIQFDIKKNG